MPCGAVLVQTARLKIDARIILSNPNAIQACRKLLASLWKLPESEIDVNESARSVRFGAGLKSVVVWDRGSLEVRPRKNTAEVQAMIERIAGAVVQQKVQQTVRDRYQVLDEQTAPNGTIVIQVEL